MSDLALGLGFALVIEGLAWALAPGGMLKLAESLKDVAPETLRAAGLAAMALGVGIVWLVRA